MDKVLIDCHLEEFQLWIKTLSLQIKGDEIILLEGEVGAGKTEFVSTLLSCLNYKEVFSPTFSLYNSYKLPSFDVDHYDLYRLENQQELDTLQFYENLTIKRLVLIEWPEKLNINDLPYDRSLYKLKIMKKINPQVRDIFYERVTP